MQAISREQLKDRMGQDNNLVLVEVLSPEQYKTGHIPGAINIPLDDEFDRAVQEAIADKSKDVVVYCASKDCHASPEAAQRMDELGYQHVYDYEEGKADWQDAGLPLVQ
jgi:rhodanese-related sulfurtransferase